MSERVIFSAYVLEMWLRIAVLRGGGELIIRLDDADLVAIDEIQMFAEAIDDGDALKLTTARVNDERAGHA